MDTFVVDRARGAQVLWGSCDPVTPARPMAPIVDMGDRVGGTLKATLRAADRDAVLDAFLALLRTPVGSGRIVVLDDLHWADAATLDLLCVVGRRLRDLPVLIVGTFRDHEVGAEHPLRLALADMPSAVVSELRLPPLSVDAVATLAGGSSLDAAELHAATGGNAFFVTEVIAADSAVLPSTVRDAVNARVSRLSRAAREAIRAASVLGQRADPDVLRAILGRRRIGIDEALASGVLQVDGGLVSFRHELARGAVLDSLTARERARPHRDALRVMRSGPVPAEPALLAHHAAAAGDPVGVLELAPAAGRRAATMGAHREAAAHFETALRFDAGHDPSVRGELLEAHARACLLTDLTESAIASQRAALECWRSLGDARREVDCLRSLSLMVWFRGEPDEAMRLATSAVALAERLSPGSAELARANATLAQRQLVAGVDDRIALETARRALELAESLGDEQTAVHALTTVGALETYIGNDDGLAMIDRSVRRAGAAGLEDDVMRALINLVEAARDLRRYEIADRYRDEALTFVTDRDLDLYRRRLLIGLAEVDLERGRWDAAEEQARLLLAERRVAPLLRARALIVLGRVQTRRGDGDPWPALNEALAIGLAGELQELVPTYSARAEAAWTAGDMSGTATEAQAGIAVFEAPPMAWLWGELAFWAWQAGVLDELTEAARPPYRLQSQGRLREAAAAWVAIGCPYQQALALADSDGEDDLREALAILHDLGAQPAIALVTRRLRDIGARTIPRGPRAATRANPGGLTDRELEVLGLLAQGLRNAEIADRLVVSAKTVDHHVSAILRKLDVPDRSAAAARAATLARTKDGEAAPAR